MDRATSAVGEAGQKEWLAKATRDCAQLHSPHAGTPWPTLTMSAKCPRPQQCSQFCFCGVFAVENVVDILYRADEAFRSITKLYSAPSMAAIVVGRVTLRDARIVCVLT
jgi:hypothetical protein